MSASARLVWALHVLDVQPDDDILEIGAGPGAAADLVCARLTGVGRLTAIDRSAAAVAQAQQRNAAHISAGRAAFERIALADYRAEARFDKVFAVNVNVFWTHPRGPELGIVKRLLRPDGVVHLLFEPPAGSGKAAQIEQAVTQALAHNGFTVAPESSPDVLAFAGRLAAEPAVTVK